MITQQIKMLTIPINIGSYQHFLDAIISMAMKRTSAYVCVANVHSCVESYANHSFGKSVTNADMVTPDGMPLKIALRWLYGVKQERIAGPDLMPKLLKVAEEKSLKVFFYGSSSEIQSKLLERFTKEYPNLNIAGMISPPFRELSESEQEEHIKVINQSGTNMVFVALGCPKQELWMTNMKGKIDAVMIGVGAAFPMLAGVEKRAPLWMQKICLEWLFRLINDPRRLFKRYFKTNIVFLYLLFKEKWYLKLTNAQVSPTFFQR